MSSLIDRHPGRLAFLILIASPAFASAATYDLTTPEKAMAVCNRAFFDGDAAALKAAGVFPPGSEELFKAFVKRGQALAATRQAVTEKFGVLAVKDYDRLLDRLLPMPTKMRVTGDTARLIVASDEGRADLIPVAEFVKSGAQWQERVTEITATKATLDKRRLAVHVETLIVEGFAKQLAGREFKTSADAAAALDSRIDTFNKASSHAPGEAVHVGLWFKYGLGVEKDPAVAYGVFTDAAAHDDPQAMAEAGLLCEAGEGTRRDPAAAFQWFKKSADAKNGEGLLHLGLCYQSGTGTPKDPAKALPLMLEALKTYDSTLNYLGDTYRDGLGVKPDDATALKYYEKAAAKLKSGYAMCEAGRCYERGHGVPKDAKKAVVWYSRSAKEENEDGMFELARHCEAGDGTIKNPAGARHWYEKAAQAGNKSAIAWVKSHPR